MTVSENPRQMDQATALPQPPTNDRIHLLLVDDDPTFRMIVQLGLKKLGYEVLAADGWESALEAAAENKDIQLLITDVMMPGMNGVMLAEKLRETHPRLEVLFMSGHPRTAIASMGVPIESINFLQKPFMSAELDERIKAILAQRDKL
jgi:DNA-binding response OmpR family regulator